jgi:hypothetical protein
MIMTNWLLCCEQVRILVTKHFYHQIVRPEKVVAVLATCVRILGGKVKCTLVQALMLCTGRTAHRGSRGITPLFHGHGTRRG